VLNDLSLGRSVAEALRMLDALRFHDERGQVCPANWQEGDEGMVPSAAALPFHSAIGTEVSPARDRNFLAGGVDGGNPAPAESRK
jgi:hypothetical protein